MNALWRWLGAALLACALPALAGTACSAEPAGPESVQKAFRLALKTRDALEMSGAEVALVARVGQDLSGYGLRYSHIAFVVRDHAQGPWRAVHLLNGCGAADSGLYVEGLANFFADDLFAWDALALLPGPELAARLKAILADPAALAALHEPRYNLVAHPYSARYQNSNQWLLEVVAAALAETPRREAAQSWLREAGYQPSRLRISTAKRLGARMFRANVAFDDHPFAQRMAGDIDTVTVESIAAFLRRQDAGLRSLTLHE